MVATETETVADLIDRLGGVPAHRIRMKPTPGTATEADVIRWLDGPNKRLFELIDGVLVEKAVGTKEGFLAGFVLRRVGDFAEDHDLGLAGAGDSPFRLRLGLVRIPDVSFISWQRIPGEEFPADAIAGLIPDLAVEVLSESNTRAEIELKLDHYFETGVRAAWVIDPKKKSAVVYNSRTRVKEIGTDGDLTAPKVLPGFRLPLRDVFASLNRKKRKPR
jgi:Uma2 family endonuclease